MSDWQTIDTAPKDARIILTNGGWVEVGWYSHSVWLGVDAADGAWVTDDPRDGPGALKDEYAPTHWMPLPEPPAA